MASWLHCFIAPLGQQHWSNETIHVISMKKINLLVITDHRTHTEENSIYALLRAMLRHPSCGLIDVASRSIDDNRFFFENMASKALYGTQMSAMFSFREDAYFFKKNLKKLSLRNYDAVLMRLPYPIPDGFWAFLESAFPHAVFVNKPSGIEKVGNKAFLLNVPDLCPPMMYCTSIEDISEFRKQFPIVLKPVKSYGGKGIVKIEGEKVNMAGGSTMVYNEFALSLKDQKIDYLAVKYLKNVQMGDKRIVVCDGEILGASLRSPEKGNWVCNVSQGGSSSPAEADENEQAIVNHINPLLEEQGVVFYGIDTLVDDYGNRVLSEINTASIGGIVQIDEYSKRSVLKRASELLWDYFSKNI